MLNHNVRNQLNELKLTKFIEVLDTSYDTYVKQNLSFSEILSILLEAEIQSRQQRKIERLIKNANFRYPSSRIEDLDYSPKRALSKQMIVNLATGSWVQKSQNLLIFGATGTGKTWLASALGVQLCRLNFDTIFINANQLIEKLQDALLDGSLDKMRRKLIKTRVLIIDDFALSRIDMRVAPMLLEIIDSQSINGSLIITSQFTIDLWHDKFEDSTIADALLDRIINQAHILEIKGESMRKLANKFDN